MLPTVADLKAHLNMESLGSGEDGELADALEAAVDVAEGIIGPLYATPITEVHRDVSADVIVLRRCPVIELTAVSRRSGGTKAALPLTDFEVEPEPGVLRSATDGRLVGTLEVSYSAGRATIPAAVRLAVLIIAAHLFETQRRPGFSSAPAGFGGSDGVPDASISGGIGYAIPHRATDLLRAYMVGPAPA